MTSSNPATPNVVMFVIDDLDVDTLQKLLDADLLPNIKNRVVNGGVNFSNAYVPSSICSPSRASMLTGKYAHNHGVWHITGDEGPQAFDTYLANTNNAYLPTWLGTAYYRGFVGKSHLGARNPNWEFFRPTDGYDLRPGMYKAWEGGKPVFPPVYQTKYVGDQAKEAIRRSGTTKPVFLMVAPTAVHANTVVWRRMDSFSDAAYTGDPVAFAQFRDEQTNNWRQHLVTVDWSSGSPLHRWWARDSQSRDSGWGAWTNNGDETTVTPNTGPGFVVAWNVLTPAPNTKRQQLVKSIGQEVRFFTRDVVNGIAQPWTPAGDQSILAGTGNLPVVGWAAIRLPSGVFRQEVVRGNETEGYQGYVRQRTETTGFTPWRIDPEWGETVAFGTVRAINLIPTTGARYIIQLMQLRPQTAKYEWWQSPEMVDFAELAAQGNNPASLGDPNKQSYPDESKLLNARFMKYTDTVYQLRNSYRDNPNKMDPIVIVRQVHPYYQMRAFAEGSWQPIAPGQTYDWDGDYPAGRLRPGHEPHAFHTSDPNLDLPVTKSSFNRQMDSGLPYFSPVAWPDLTNEVQGGLEQEDYLRRLLLDRMEQMLTVDRMVGEVLDAAGPNTIVIFTSDNGHFNGEHRLSNKLTAHEESSHVPLYIKRPGGTAREVSRLVANIDIAPTILDYAGKNWASTSYNVDGRSLRPLIDTAGVPSWRTSLLIEYHRPRGADYPATDWRFGLPDYLALRIADEVAGQNGRSLYIQYFMTLSDMTSGFSYEQYFMTVDPFQTTNAASGQNNALAIIMRDYYVSSGPGCRVQDSISIP